MGGTTNEPNSFRYLPLRRQFTFCLVGLLPPFRATVDFICSSPVLLDLLHPQLIDCRIPLVIPDTLVQNVQPSYVLDVRSHVDGVLFYSSHGHRMEPPAGAPAA